jgi:hypothetical protein
MPYHISKVKGGFKVKHGNKAFSKKPLTKAKAERQMAAIYANEAKQSKKHK